MWGRIHRFAVIPAQAGISVGMVAALLAETPAFAGVTVCWDRHD
jgi:hypothetical protein